MPVDAELLEILACPNCKTPVALVKNGTASSAEVSPRLSDQGRHPGDADRRGDLDHRSSDDDPEVLLSGCASSATSSSRRRSSARCGGTTPTRTHLSGRARRRPIVAANPHLDDVIIVAAPPRPGADRGRHRLARRLARGGYDLAIDLHGGPRSAWLTWASGAPTRIGYDIPGRTWMYTEAVTRSRPDAAALGAQSVGPACAVGHPATGSGARSAADARQS